MNYDVLFIAMIVMGVALVALLRLAWDDFGKDDHPCDRCGRSTGIDWKTKAYYCSYECAAYSGDFSVRSGWKVDNFEEAE